MLAMMNISDSRMGQWYAAGRVEGKIQSGRRGLNCGTMQTEGMPWTGIGGRVEGRPMTSRFLILPFLMLLILICASCAHTAKPSLPITGITGVVVDEQAKPVEGVTVQLCGIEKFGVRVIRLGLMPQYLTDREGRFLLPFHETDARYDLWFDKFGFAPTFLYGISGESQELKVVLRRGIPLSGTVTRVVNGLREPVFGTTITLRLPSEDLWYQNRTLTDDNGRYMFRVSPPPRGYPWLLYLLGQVVELYIKQGDSAADVDFVASVDFNVKVTP